MESMEGAVFSSAMVVGWCGEVVWGFRVGRKGEGGAGLCGAWRLLSRVEDGGVTHAVPGVSATDIKSHPCQH